jgi:hypothetical protein
LLLVGVEDLGVATSPAVDGPFSILHSEAEDGVVEENLFPTVRSVLTLEVSNLTSQELADLQLANLSCVAEENMVGPSVFASTQLTIQCK